MVIEMVSVSLPVVPQPIYMNADELNGSGGQKPGRSFSMPGQVCFHSCLHV